MGHDLLCDFELLSHMTSCGSVNQGYLAIYVVVKHQLQHCSKTRLLLSGTGWQTIMYRP